jgi:hypothetical protein
MTSGRLQSTTEYAYGTEQASFCELLQEMKKCTHSNSAIWPQKCAHVANW